MSRNCVQKFAAEKISEAAANNKLLCLDLELAPDKADTLTVDELVQVIHQAAALGTQVCNLCSSEVPDVSLLKNILICTRTLGIAANLELPGRMLTKACAELLQAHNATCSLYYSGPEDMPQEVLQLLPEDSVEILLLPQHGSNDSFFELWEKFSAAGRLPAAACMTEARTLPPADTVPDGDEQAAIEERCGILLPGCLQLLCACSVSSCGIVYPCFAMETPLGDLRKNSLEEIYCSSKILSLHREHPKRLQAPCSGCVHAGKCCGCAARTYQQTGNYMAADPRCGRNQLNLDRINALPQDSKGMLPHAETMLLVDRVIFLSELYSVHEAIVRPDNPFLRTDGILEPNALPEYAAQAAALRDSVEKGGEPSPGLLCEISKTRFYKTVRVGDKLTIKVETEYNMDMWFSIRFTITVHGEIAAEGVLKLCIYTDSPLPY